MSNDLVFLGHACVRLERDGTRLLVDPGVFADADVFDGADAVLITHEHIDHVVAETLGAALAADEALQVWAPQAAVDALVGEGLSTERFHAVAGGDTVEVAGHEVVVHGEQHAVIHADIPVIANVAYLIDGVVLHPGDSYTVPDGVDVPVLLAPVGGPWLKISEVVDYVRAVAPRLVVPIHDAPLSDAGRGIADRTLTQLGGAPEFRRLAVGERLVLPE